MNIFSMTIDENQLFRLLTMMSMQLHVNNMWLTSTNVRSIGN